MKAIAKLEQRKFFRRSQSLEIRTDGLLYVESGRPFAHESWTLPLKYLDPNPTRSKQLDLKPLILAVPFTLFAIPCLIGAVSTFLESNPGDGVVLVGFAGICGLIAGFFYWNIYANSLNVLSFAGAQGARIPLWFNNPTREEFEDFAQKFKEAIESARAFEDNPIEADLRMLQELLDRELLDKEQFESAKEKLLNRGKAKKMGF